MREMNSLLPIIFLLTYFITISLCSSSSNQTSSKSLEEEISKLNDRITRLEWNSVKKQYGVKD